MEIFLSEDKLCDFEFSQVKIDESTIIEIAFCNGSLFPNIDKPFFGGKKV